MHINNDCETLIEFSFHMLFREKSYQQVHIVKTEKEKDRVNCNYIFFETTT